MQIEFSKTMPLLQQIVLPQKVDGTYNGAFYRDAQRSCPIPTKTDINQRGRRGFGTKTLHRFKCARLLEKFWEVIRANVFVWERQFGERYFTRMGWETWVEDDIVEALTNANATYNLSCTQKQVHAVARMVMVDVNRGVKNKQTTPETFGGGPGLNTYHTFEPENLPYVRAK